MDRIDYENRFNDALPDMIGLLSIRSAYDKTSVSETTPYGVPVHEALMYMKKIAERDGFEVREYEDQAISFSHGKGKERIDIASHLDVVAADEETFRIRVEDGKIYGRGTSDMKIPMYLTYLSLKLLRERHPHINKEIRIVLGSDEERTMNDMKLYVAKEGLPAFAFTPDGYFPMAIGEKGSLMWKIKGEYEGIIEMLDGGSQCNVIPGHASCVLKNDDLYEEIDAYISEHSFDASLEKKNGKLQITVQGVPAHASLPKLGHSALVDLLQILSEVCHDATCEDLYKLYHDGFGRGFGHYISEDPYECLSLNLGVLRIKEGKLSGLVDCRYPYGLTAEQLTEDLISKTPFTVTLPYNEDPTLCSIEDPYVKMMLETYREITKDETEPIISGGVSYAKVFRHCVSFGPNFPGEKSTAHQKEEYLELKNCIRMFQIYYETIEKIALAEMDDE